VAACSGTSGDTESASGGAVVTGLPDSGTLDGGPGSTADGSKSEDGGTHDGDPTTEDTGTETIDSGPPVGPDSGTQDGTETDVDCGGPTAPACGDGKACLLASDCTSKVCTANVCAAPSATDKVQNGDESDVDCGGAAATTPRCAAAKKCTVHTDCASNACPNKRCSEAPSCKQLHGGATCGAGELGGLGTTHEDCCVSLTVPRPVAKGGDFKLDKYLITAGRMRAFLESVNYDVRGWIAAHRPAWWTGSGTTTWDAMLPTNADEFLSMSVTGSSGCYIGKSAAANGAMAYWAAGADLDRVVGGGPRTYTKDELDTKVMNCFRAPLFHALCAFDGGRLASRDEWIAARTENGVVRPYPWGSNGTDADRRARAVYDFNYAWPRQPVAADADRGGYLPAPGRFPLGAGPYGHQDLLGSLENMGSRPGTGAGVTGDGWFQFSFQEPEIAAHPYGQQYVGFGTGAYRPHWAVGARCVKLP